MPWGAVVGAMIASSASRRNQKSATAANVEAMKNRHTWEVQDLKNAGLNPILSAGGSGTGGMPSAQGAPVVDYGSTITNALQTESNIGKQDAEIDLILAQTGLTQENQIKVKAEVDNIKQLTDKAFQETQGMSYQNANEYDRTMFLQSNPQLLQAGSALRELGIRGDALTGILASTFKIPKNIIKKLFGKIGGKK